MTRSKAHVGSHPNRDAQLTAPISADDAVLPTARVRLTRSARDVFVAG